MENIFKERSRIRHFAFFAADIILISFSIFLAFFLRFDGKIPESYFNGTLWEMIIIALIFCLYIFNYFRLYSFSWAYVSTEELVSLMKAVFLSFIFIVAALMLLREFSIIGSFPRSTLIISFFLVFIFCGGIRIAKRVFLQLFKRRGGNRVLIVGAGDVGEQIARNILSSKEDNFSPVGFVDDSPERKGVRIHGLDVLGKINDIPEIALDYNIKELIIALPSSQTQLIKRAVELGRKAGLVRIKTVPMFDEIISGEVSVKNLKEVQVEDLLGREPVFINTKEIRNFISNKPVLITGAAGSIGSELSRQIAKFGPSLLLLLDQDETGIFNITNEIRKKYPTLNVRSFVKDIINTEKIDKIFESFQPKIVFHAAAYKHVPLMEEQPDEAIKNNVFGTKTVAEAALKFGAEKFVFISTDKAVNPTSVMGATKRIGEMICQNLNQKNRTKFVSVRFGNVLDSRGSVIPIFKEQIRKRGPVEVTHPDMKRYFMLIPEACLLVMQAAEMGTGGEVFVLNMGKPVKILDLAKDMIRLSGYEPDKDIAIVFTGVRPGEKMFEEILSAEEGTDATKNPDIFIAKLSGVNEEKLNLILEKFRGLADTGNKSDITGALKEALPTYSPES